MRVAGCNGMQDKAQQLLTQCPVLTGDAPQAVTFRFDCSLCHFYLHSEDLPWLLPRLCLPAGVIYTAETWMPCMVAAAGALTVLYCAVSINNTSCGNSLWLTETDATPVVSLQVFEQPWPTLRQQSAFGLDNCGTHG